MSEMASVHLCSISLMVSGTPLRTSLALVLITSSTVKQTFATLCLPWQSTTQLWQCSPRLRPRRTPFDGSYRRRKDISSSTLPPEYPMSRKLCQTRPRYLAAGLLSTTKENADSGSHSHKHPCSRFGYGIDASRIWRLPPPVVASVKSHFPIGRRPTQKFEVRPIVDDSMKSHNNGRQCSWREANDVNS
jgi:hypothetical protein